MKILIAGTRGVPASHGGFETFAEDFARYLVKRNHTVVVYCQVEDGSSIREDVWQGIHRVLIPAPASPLGTVWFDCLSARHICKQDGVILTLGSNTGFLSLLYRIQRRPSLMNMDGIEWRRQKWSRLQRLWLKLNEWAGAYASTRVVADHPQIGRRLGAYISPRKIAVIPYGADKVNSAPVAPLFRYGLTARRYYLVIARAEPENSILEIIRGYSISQSQDPLVILGKYNPDTQLYHRRVKEAASAGVYFLGPIYERGIVQSLRFHTKAYIHGHQAGGTNPSLVESLAAGTAVIAHDNCFNRWVAGENAQYFSSPEDLAAVIRSLESDPKQLVKMAEGSRRRHCEEFKQEDVLSAYEQLISEVCGLMPHERRASLRG